MHDLIRTLLEHNEPFYLEGSPGMGKSSIIKAIAGSLNMELYDFRASSLLPEDMQGLPALNHDRTSVSYIASQTVQSVMASTETRPAVLFFDELNQAAPSVQKALYKVMLDRVWGDVPLPAHTRIVGAGNNESLWAELEPPSPALVGQNGRLIPVTPSAQDFWKLASKHLSDKYPDSQVLKTILEHKELPSPRTVEKVVKLWPVVHNSSNAANDMLRMLLGKTLYNKVHIMMTGMDPESSRNALIMHLTKIAGEKYIDSVSTAIAIINNPMIVNSKVPKSARTLLSAWLFEELAVTSQDLGINANNPAELLNCLDAMYVADKDECYRYIEAKWPVTLQDVTKALIRNNN